MKRNTTENPHARPSRTAAGKYAQSTRQPAQYEGNGRYSPLPTKHRSPSDMTVAGSSAESGVSIGEGAPQGKSKPLYSSNPRFHPNRPSDPHNRLNTKRSMQFGPTNEKSGTNAKHNTTSGHSSVTDISSGNTFLQSHSQEHNSPRPQGFSRSTDHKKKPLFTKQFVPPGQGNHGYNPSYVHPPLPANIPPYAVPYHTSPQAHHAFVSAPVYSWDPNVYYQPPQPQSYIPPPQESKAIRIVNPYSREVVNPINISTSTSTTTSSSSKETRKTENFRPSMAIKIVDPAIKEREEREKKEREEAALEAELKEKEEAERKEKERIEAEKKAKEELERKKREQLEWEEKERLEAEKKARLEQERKEEEERIRQELESIKLSKLPSIPAFSSVSPRFSDRPLPASPGLPRTPYSPIRHNQEPSTIEYPHYAKENQSPKATKIQYDLEFLLQFQSICKHTDEDLSAFRVTAEPPVDRNINRQTSNRPRYGSSMESPMYRQGSKDGRSDSKYSSNRSLPPRSGNSYTGSQMQRDDSHGRSRSNRGNNTRVQQRSQQGGPTIPLDQVAPLEKSENRWIPNNTKNSFLTVNNTESQQIISGKVKALLNKLTLEKFDKISSQIYDFAKQSTEENDAQSLKTVLDLTFEKACDEANFAEMWVKLFKMMESKLREDKYAIKDSTQLGKDGKPLSGANLFRQWLVSRCENGFTRGWQSTLQDTNVDLFSDEYYAGEKNKRQGLGLVQLIGHLFMQRMLSDRDMFKYLDELCKEESLNKDEMAESLCKLLTTIGKELERSQSLNGLFAKIQRKLADTGPSQNLSLRVRFRLQDVVDLRRNGWTSRKSSSQGPQTIAQIHRQEEESKRNQSNGRNMYSTSRQGSRRTGREYQTEGPGGWSTINSSNATKTRLGFGKNDRSRSTGTYESPFASLRQSGLKSTALSKANTTIGRSSPAPVTRSNNVFDALGDEDNDSDHSVDDYHSADDDHSEDDEHSQTPQSDATGTHNLNTAEKEAAKRRAGVTLDEYIVNRIKYDLVEDVKELDGVEHHVILVSVMLDVVGDSKKIDFVCEMIDILYEEELIAREVYVDTLKEFLKNLDDLTIDSPKAPTHTAAILVAAKVDPLEVIPEGEGSEYVFRRLQEDYKKALGAA